MRNAAEIAEATMQRLRDNIAIGMEERGKNATGDTARSMRVITTGGTSFGQADLEANSNWRYVGNGRGPGGIPPIANIQSWIAAKGLDLSAWGVALKIAREGSRDFRLKRTNVFLDEIKAWEAKDVPAAEQELIDNTAQSLRDTLNTP